MTEDEALKLALESLEWFTAAEQGDEPPINKAITAIKEALAQPEQDPAAWIHNFIEGGISIGKRPSDLNRHPDRWTALYRESKPCQTCEALARTVMLDQTSHDTKLPWVGLTNEEIANSTGIYPTMQPDKWHETVEIVRATEAKLKEKNT